MRCKDAQILINEYLDGTLDEARREALFAHIDACVHCKEEMEQLTALKSVLKSLPEQDPPKGLLSGAIEKAKPVLPGRRKGYFPRRAVAGIAAAVVITIGAVWYFSNDMQYSQSPADMAAPKAKMITAMEAPAQTPETLMQTASQTPELMQAAPQTQTAIPSASTAAASSAPPAQSAARNGSCDKESLKSGSDLTGAGMDAKNEGIPAIEITVEAAKSKDFYDDLMALIAQNNIPYGITEADDMSIVSLALEEPNLNAIDALLKEYDLGQTLEVPAAMNFVFRKS